jgi:hypothetical protein
MIVKLALLAARRATLTVIGDSGRRRSLVECGLARARGFTWERAARETLDVLEEPV